MKAKLDFRCFKLATALLLLCMSGTLIACNATVEAERSTAQTATPLPVTDTPSVTPTRTPPPTVPPPATPTTAATATPTPTPEATPTSTAIPTATPIPLCSERIPDADNLLTIVTLTYGISREYEPQDLVKIDSQLPFAVTLGYPTEIREPALQPLVDLIAAMQAEGLNPFIISGYRSYASQAIAYAKWKEKYPDTASILSARPGFSEHQLGTTVDFGSPELASIVGEEIEFHTYFYQTSEGKWLAENAHKYGWTLSYPRDAFELTGFFYEPWHYRYVGVELATMLHEEETFLTSYLLDTYPVPCIPE
ncbi:MAG: M15 family metallopeptidase [Anaerolineae bacterium]|nr:M15 family metallopeptidase [Anaerolineae bacterium]